MQRQHRVLIADDHPIVLEGIRSSLSEDSRLKVIGEARIGEARTGKDAIRQTEAQQPDVLVLDIAMAEGYGQGVLATLKRQSPKTKIVIHTVHTTCGSRKLVALSSRCIQITNLQAARRS